MAMGVVPVMMAPRGALRNHPSLLGLDRLLEAELANPEGASEHGPVPGADLTLLRSLIHKHTQRLDRYACRNCGFQARRFYWQCPGCNAWETYARLTPPSSEPSAIPPLKPAMFRPAATAGARGAWMCDSPITRACKAGTAA
ncbi:hypothetical protein [Lactiplantibacillus plantarum]|uniref:hypothetical protein n=1 Tax=Lactiplantibacillus plantarum TaxID=1590 RepID=UPI004046778B